MKFNAQQRYAPDAHSVTPVQLVAKNQQLALQKFVSRNDIPCGTTIGLVHASLVGMPIAEISCNQLSMHPCHELTACQDHPQYVQAIDYYATKSLLKGPKSKKDTQEKNLNIKFLILYSIEPFILPVCSAD